jgi:hypothetical protein
MAENICFKNRFYLNYNKDELLNGGIGIQWGLDPI